MQNLQNEDSSSESLSERIKPSSATEQQSGKPLKAESAGTIVSAREAVGKHSREHKRLVSTTVFGFIAFTVVLTVVVQWLVHHNRDSEEFWRSQFPMLTSVSLVLLLGSIAGLIWKGAVTGRRGRSHAYVLAADTDADSVGALIDLFKFDERIEN